MENTKTTDFQSKQIKTTGKPGHFCRQLRTMKFAIRSGTQLRCRLKSLVVSVEGAD